jgi:hypothetical protein
MMVMMIMWLRGITHFMEYRRRKRDRKTQGTRYSPGPVPGDLLLLARPFLLKFPEPPQIMPPAGTYTLLYEPVGDISFSN